MECTKYTVNQGIIEISPQEHHDFEGEACPVCCTNTMVSPENVLRIKFLVLFFLKLILFSPVQILYRLQDLVTGGFYFRGREIAIHKHLSLRLEELKGRAVPKYKIAYRVFLEFIKDICRIVLYPLYFIAMEFCAVVGWVCPVRGMCMASRLDQLYYVHPIKPYEKASCLEDLGNLAVPCMQTKEFRKEMYLYRHAIDYDPDQPLSIYYHLKHLTDKASKYFTYFEFNVLHETINAIHKEDADELSDNVEPMLDAIDHINEAIVALSRGNREYRDSLRLAYIALQST